MINRKIFCNSGAWPEYSFCPIDGAFGNKFLGRPFICVCVRVYVHALAWVRWRNSAAGLLSTSSSFLQPSASFVYLRTCLQLLTYVFEYVFMHVTHVVTCDLI